MSATKSFTPQMIKEYKGHRASIYDLIAHGNSDIFYSVGGDGWIVQWDTDSPDSDGKLIAQTETQLFCGLHLLHQNHLVVGDMHGHMYWIDLNTYQILHRYYVHRNAIFALIFVHDNVLVTASGDGCIGIWDVEKARHVMNIQLSLQGLRSLAYRNEILYVGGSDNTIYMVDTTTWTVKDKIPGAHANSVFTLWAHEKGLFSGGRDAHLILRPYDNIHTVSESLPAHWFTINKIIELTGLNLLATASRDKTIRLWQPSCAPIFTIDHKISRHTHSVNTLLWLPHSQKLISAGDDRVVKVFEWME